MNDGRSTRWVGQRSAVTILLAGIVASLPGAVLAAEVKNIATIGLELSAVAAVPGGVLVADDELVGAALFVEHDAVAGNASSLGASLVKIDRSRKDSAPNTGLPRLFAVQDIEGLAASADGSTIYVIGSHAPTRKKGHRRTDREFLIRARWRPDEPDLRVGGPKKNAVPGIYRKLRDHLVDQPGIGERTGINVEGLALRGDTLHIGLRAPLSRGNTGNALVFSARERALFGSGSSGFQGPFTRLELDLGGGGVRGLHWDPASGKLLVLSGPSGDEGGAPRALWSYDFEARRLAREYTFSEAQLRELGNPEGITRFDGERLLVVFDTDKATRASLVLLRWK